MGDFFLDLRPANLRSLGRLAERFRFVPALRTTIIDESDFGLILSETGKPELWAPYRGEDETLVAVAGRPSFDASEWADAPSAPGDGGTASKAIYLRYRRHGLRGLTGISGNCVVVVHEPRESRLLLVTDCSSAFPTFECLAGEAPVYSSHPDLLAAGADQQHALDEISLAEFLLCSTVTPPYTYYQRVRATPHGTLLSFDLPFVQASTPSVTRYFDFSFQGDPSVSEEALAHELADALRRSVQRRTLPLLGTSAVALSGGLDSRALLACADDPARTFAFTCFDQPNTESRVAESVARALGVRFVPLQRSPDYYGDHAELGVRISGGMGSLANNHFLGVMDRLHSEGMDHLLTGCYFDYLFKGLPLNRRTVGPWGREELAPFRPQFYFGHRLSASPLVQTVQERWATRIPIDLQSQDSTEKVFDIEVRRTFPLCYEGDNQQRVVPQRVTGWYLPVADRDVLHVYRRLPYPIKLNRSVFLKAFLSLQPKALASIPDANTGVRPGASPLQEAAVAQWLRLQRHLRRFRRSLATNTSWPDWEYYVSHSQKLRALWQRPNPDALDLLRRIAGPNNVRKEPSEYVGRDLFLLVSLLTLKLWLDQRSA